MPAIPTHQQVLGVKPFRFDMWGMWPSDACTSNAFYGCERMSDQGAQLVINPIQSARLRTTGTFTFQYGRLEVEAKLPRGVSYFNICLRVCHHSLDSSLICIICIGLSHLLTHTHIHTFHIYIYIYIYITGLVVACYLVVAGEERLRPMACLGRDRPDGVPREQAWLCEGRLRQLRQLHALGPLLRAGCLRQ